MRDRLPGRALSISTLTVLFLFIASCAPAPAATSNTTPTPSSQDGTPASGDIPCTVFHTPVTPNPALGAEFGSKGHTSGPSDAPVTIIAFSDYQCLQCAFLAASLRQVRLAHPDDVYLVYLHAPQAGMDKDNLAIQAVEAADLQGKFWEMHDLLFEKQTQWTPLAPADFESWAADEAAGLGMDPARFRSDFEGRVVADRLKQAVKAVSSGQLFTPRCCSSTALPPIPGWLISPAWTWSSAWMC